MSEEKELKKVLNSGNTSILKLYLGNVYSKYFKLVCLCISKYINNKETIEDLANDTFIKVFNKLNDINGSIKYYLVVSANNIAKDYLKKIQDTQLDNDIDIESNDTKFNSYISYKELLDDLSSVLSKEEVDIIIKHVLEGYTFKELSEIYKYKEKKLSSLYFRAIKKFNKLKGKKYL